MSLPITRNEKELRYLVVLFGAEYFSVYHFQSITPLLALAAIILSYYLLWKYNNFSIIVMLILSARVINGFIIPGATWSYTLFMLITYYLPVFIFLIRNIKIRNGVLKVKKDSIRCYRIVILFVVYYIFLFVLNIRESSSLFLESILPIVLFVLCVALIPKEAFKGSIEPIMLYLRMIFLISLILYVLPRYEEITSTLVKSGKPFGVPVEATGTLMYLGVFRNNGIFFDCRILGIFTYIYIYLIGVTKRKVSIVDVVLSGVTVATTLSRGGIVGYLIILLGYLVVCDNTKSKYIFLGIGGFSLLSIIIFYVPSMGEVASKFLSTFNLNQSYNVLSQRSVMSDFAIDAFKAHPIMGGGIGSLTASNPNRIVFSSSYVTYNVVTDAYLFSLLGEIGIIGTGFFLLQLYKIISAYSKKHFLSLMLYLGMVIHLLGTDIPRMRLVYFCVLLIISIANWSKTAEINHVVTHKACNS